MVNFIWPVVSSVASTLLTGGIAAVWRALHNRFNDIEQHLREQDLRIARIEGRVS